MWKRLDEQASFSRRIAGLSDQAFRVWVMLLPHTDCRGRFPADPVTVQSRAFPRGPLPKEEIAEALAELVQAGSIHVYKARGEDLLVYHDHDQLNPPGRLLNQRPKWPAPPVDLCSCLAAGGADGRTSRKGTPEQRAELPGGPTGV